MFGRSVTRIFGLPRYRFGQTDISRKEAMAGLTYSGKAFRDLMNSNYYPLANMKKSVAKLKASEDIHLPDPGIRSVSPDPDPAIELAAGKRQALAQGEGSRSRRPQHAAEHGPPVQG